MEKKEQKIRLLNDVVANQIAAGEVVNRPASVVKEMLENTVDAGATTVTVNFRDGGKELIQVIDDGCGMSPVDARMAFDRHATSKIAELDDIYALHTFGFRGEALASIAAVSEVELRTRAEGDEVGTLTQVNGGQFVSQTPIACPKGSQFSVKNLFYNVPARRKFLERTTTSSSQIKAEFQRVALCNPQVAFELLMNDQPLYNLPVATLPQRIVDVVGRSMKQNLCEVEADTSIVRVEGFVGKPDTARRGTNSSQYFFVNGRFFRSHYFYKAVLAAYQKLIPDNCTPSYFLYLTIDPSRIDVNVHPQKTEVKFADEQAIWQIINASVRETLAKTGSMPLMDFDGDAGVEIPTLSAKGVVYDEPKAAGNLDYNPFAPMGDGMELPQLTAGGGIIGGASRDTMVKGGRGGGFGKTAFMSFGSSSLDMGSHATEFDIVPSREDFDPDGLSPELALGEEQARFTEIVLVGGGYASAIYGGRWVVVDLRRARERVLFDRYVLLLENGSSVSQQLLFSERLAFSTDEYELLEEHAVDFAGLGFDMELLGDGEVEMRGIPADATHDGIEGLIYELLQVFAMPVDIRDQRRVRVASAMAKSGASGFSRGASKEQVVELLEQLRQGGNLGLTPSGKAIMTEITPEEIKERLE